mmetsp:Transcript_27837/g.47597  ORF Transcript_27837/g.47597 Transcript_27837/m.47597 type:complete len:196 (-) Transcript_27837:85-672(-)
MRSRAFTSLRASRAAPSLSASSRRLCALRPGDDEIVWSETLADAMRTGATALRLRGSEELVCMNMMCDSVGQTCLCRLSMVLERMHRLRHIDLRGNGLERLPEIWRLPNLETIDVRDNNITSVPDELATLASLRVLRVANNPLRRVPPALAHLTDVGADGSVAGGAASEVGTFRGAARDGVEQSGRRAPGPRSHR